MLQRNRILTVLVTSLVAIASLGFAIPSHAEHSIARQWNEELLEAIRKDFARPTVHARNLFHTSIAMWDSWAAYDDFAVNYLHLEKANAENVAAARHETMSYAVYRILVARFANSPGANIVLPSFDAKMAEYGYDTANAETQGDSPSALGNRIAEAVLAFGAADTSNEANDYANLFYSPVNPALIPALPGNWTLLDPNAWQPLALEFFIDQSGNILPFGSPPFLSPEWGSVTPFAMTDDDLSIYEKYGNVHYLYHDPGPPPLLGSDREEEYRSGFDQVVEWSALLDPSDGVMIDIGPGARGNNTLGTNDGTGHVLNPKTGQPYPVNLVPAGDYYRVLAEFWADGPDSETPPGHWFTIANYVSDHPEVDKKIGGVGPVVDDLEWDVKLYQALAGAVHDSAVAAWGVKGYYDYIRPVSAIRYMADRGQRSDPMGPSYHPDGLTLAPGRVEVVTQQSIQPGERHAHFASYDVGKIAIRAWRGPNFIADPATSTAGVGWILAENWWPYQRPSFVTPPFAGYVSGHSTFSRAAAELMTLFTGDAYFPGGLGEFVAPQNEFLVFEEGPSVDVTLQWATYRDASDETSISRIYGGIHPTADDIPGRLMGAEIGPDAFDLATSFWGPWKTLDLQNVRVGRRGNIFVRGHFPLGFYGDEDVLNLDDGLVVTLRDKNGESIVLEFPACQALPRDRARCRGAERGSVATFSPRKDGTVHFMVRGMGPTAGNLLDGPLTLILSTGELERAGESAACRINGRSGIDCNANARGMHSSNGKGKNKIPPGWKFTPRSIRLR